VFREQPRIYIGAGLFHEAVVQRHDGLVALLIVGRGVFEAGCSQPADERGRSCRRPVRPKA